MFQTKLYLAVFATIAVPIAVLAVDGTTLINQSTVMAAGGFPYQITQTGSYRLSGNLIANGKTAINITGYAVTLDLNGFSISCSGCSGAPGIVSSGFATTIQNGTVLGFNGTTGSPYGIYFQANGGKVDHVTLISNGVGIQSDNTMDVTVTNSTVVNSFSTGINCGGTLIVIDSKISANSGDGILMVSGLVTGSSISGNGSAITSGTRGGIGVTSTANITNNAIFNNSIMGIFSTVGSNEGIGAGSNTFFGQSADMFGAVTSMKNNVCSAGMLVNAPLC